MRKLLPVLLLVAVALVACQGADSNRNDRRDETRSETGFTEEEEHELDGLATLGYLDSGGPAYEDAGVTAADTGAYDGYTVCVSSDFSGAFIMDMNGNVLHEWRDDGDKHWDRAYPYPDGRVLGIQTFPGCLLELDSGSNVVWTFGDHTSPGKVSLKAHHDLSVRPDGTIYVLMRTGRRILEERQGLFVEDLLLHIEPGDDSVTVLSRLSIAQAFLDSEYEDLFRQSLSDTNADPTHVNSICILDGMIDDPAFAAGNILLSVRNLDCLAVLDPDARRIVWVNRGRWEHQHEARVTPNGTILLFDNRPNDRQSRIVEFDPVRDEVVWEYTEPNLFSELEGSEQLLPNGNLLIAESRRGRLFELADRLRIVWEYLNPRTTDEGESVAYIPRALRVGYDYFTGAFGDSLRRRRLGQ